MAPRLRFPIPNLNSLDPSVPAKYAPWTSDHVRRRQLRRLDKEIEYHEHPDSIEYKRAQTLVRSNPGIESTLMQDEYWICEKFLGAGSFGQVAHWMKVDYEGNNVDNIAIKQVYFNPMKRHRDLIYHVPTRRQIPKEVLMMIELQRHECDSILQIRNVKEYPHASCWRYYLEFCSEGDISKLVSTYCRLREDVNENAYFPEEFLWHVFHEFAKAISVMATGPFHELDTGMPSQKYVLHLDVKPSNIFLSDPIETAEFASYPSIKLGDWGLAALTNKVDRNNPKDYRYSGTPRWYPPEQKSSFAEDWQDPNPYYNPQKELLPFSASLNIWVFGAIMYHLMSLDYEGDELLNRLSLVKYREDLYNLFDGNLYGSSSDIRSERVPEYSTELRETIRLCLNLDPARRISPEQLLQRTKANLKVAKEKLLGVPEPELLHEGYLDASDTEGEEDENKKDQLPAQLLRITRLRPVAENLQVQPNQRILGPVQSSSTVNPAQLFPPPPPCQQAYAPVSESEQQRFPQGPTLPIAPPDPFQFQFQPNFNMNLKCICTSPPPEPALLSCETCGTQQHAACYYNLAFALPPNHYCSNCYLLRMQIGLPLPGDENKGKQLDGPDDSVFESMSRSRHAQARRHLDRHIRHGRPRAVLRRGTDIQDRVLARENDPMIFNSLSSAILNMSIPEEERRLLINPDMDWQPATTPTTTTTQPIFHSPDANMSTSPSMSGYARDKENECFSKENPYARMWLSKLGRELDDMQRRQEQEQEREQDIHPDLDSSLENLTPATLTKGFAPANPIAADPGELRRSPRRIKRRELGRVTPDAQQVTATATATAAAGLERTRGKKVSPKRKAEDSVGAPTVAEVGRGGNGKRRLRRVGKMPLLSLRN